MLKTYEIQEFIYGGCYTLLTTLDERRLTAVPEGFNNNVLWNIGHILVTHQLLCYGRSGLPTPASQELVETFRKGTRPGPSGGIEHLAAIRDGLAELPARSRQDYEAGRFASYDPYTTSSGVVLESIDDALLYSCMHDGLHRGAVAALLKVPR